MNETSRYEDERGSGDVATFILS